MIGRELEGWVKQMDGLNAESCPVFGVAVKRENLKGHVERVHSRTTSRPRLIQTKLELSRTSKEG